MPHAPRFRLGNKLDLWPIKTFAVHQIGFAPNNPPYLTDLPLDEVFQERIAASDNHKPEQNFQ